VICVRTVEFPVEAGGTVLVQVPDELPAGPVMRGRGAEATIDRADQTFEMALSTIRTVANGVVLQLKDIAVRPQHVTVEFGIELTGKMGSMLVAASASAQLKVSLTWQPKEAG
jgi:Trypsin-co-occurring domain 1